MSISEFTQTHITLYATKAQKDPVFREMLEKVYMFKKEGMAVYTQLFWNTNCYHLSSAQEKIATTCHSKSQTAASC